VDSERLLQLSATRTADRRRWRDPASYKPEWVGRAELAASLLPDGMRVLEIGTGSGVFRRLVDARCSYTGADLEPLDRDVIALDLDCDPLPATLFDFVVVLGVFEYLYHPLEAAMKLCGAASNIVVSYAAVREAASKEVVGALRQKRGWVNEFTKTEFLNLFIRNGFAERECIAVSEDEDFQQYLLLLSSQRT
jgi:hypothetical protein